MNRITSAMAKQSQQNVQKDVNWPWNKRHGQQV